MALRLVKNEWFKAVNLVLKALSSHTITRKSKRRDAMILQLVGNRNEVEAKSVEIDKMLALEPESIRLVLAELFIPF